MSIGMLDWGKLRGLGALPAEVLPVAVQDADSGDVLMVAYANREAVAATLESGEAVFWSTSRNEIHHKGSTYGDFLDLVEIRVNCEANSLLYRVRLRGQGACHVRDADGRSHRSCFFRTLD